MFPLKDNIPDSAVPVVTLGLILANVVVYLLSIVHGGGLFSGPSVHEVFKYGAIPYALSHGGAHCSQVTSGWWSYPPLHGRSAFAAVDGHNLCGHALSFTPYARMNTLPSGLTIITALFLHASLVHLVGNMLFLWIFGNTVEQSLGRLRYLLLYLLAGVVALGLEVALAPHSAAPTLGSSGAVAGVLGAYLVLYPRGRVLAVVFILLFFTVIELPLWIMLAAWVAEQAVFGATDLITPAGGRNAIAYFGYLGGFAFGLLAVKLLVERIAPKPAPV